MTNSKELATIDRLMAENAQLRRDVYTPSDEIIDRAIEMKRTAQEAATKAEQSLHNDLIERCAQRLHQYMIDAGLRGWANDGAAAIRELKDKSTIKSDTTESRCWQELGERNAQLEEARKEIAALTTAAEVERPEVEYVEGQAVAISAGPSAAEVGERSCTCHPADNPPDPCPKQYAYTECIKAATIERCARVAEARIKNGYACDAVAAIRALKDQP